MNKMDEANLVEALKNGNAKAFSFFISKYQAYINSRCKFYLKNDEEAQDLSQEILIKVFLQIQNFREQAQLKTWIFSIIHNSCMDYLRKNKKNALRRLSISLNDEIADQLQDEIVEINDDNLEAEDLEKLMEELSPEGRMILVLKYKEKHSIKDIELSLGLSESAVKMRLSRAKEILRNIIKERSRKKSL